MISHTARVTIRRALPEVFATVTELDAHLGIWARGVMAVRRVSAGPIVPGTEFSIAARAGPFRLLCAYRVLAYERESIFAGRGTTRPMRFTEHYTFGLGSGGATIIDYAVEVRGRRVFHLLERLMARRMRRLVDGNFARLRRLLEVESRAVPRRDPQLP